MIEQIKNQLVALARSYAGHRNITLSRVSFLVRGNGNFFAKIEGGADMTLGTAQRVLQWFSDNWPVDLEWPRDVPRPAPSKTKSDTKRGAA